MRKIKLLVYLFILPFLFFGFYNKNSTPFPNSKEEIILLPKKIEKHGSYSYLPENQIAPFYIFTSKKARVIENKKLYQYKFGVPTIKNEYLFIDKNIIYIAYVDSNKIDEQQALFDFNKFNNHDTIIIKKMGILLNHKMIFNNFSISKTNDTIIEYDLIRIKESLNSERIDDGRGAAFYKLKVSKKKGIISLQKDTEYYLITYG